MNSEDPHQQDVLREQTKLLFEHLPFVLTGVLASATGFTAVLWSKGQTELLAGWLLLVYLLTAVRWFTRKRFLELGNNFDPDKWINVAIQLTAASGVLWGVAGVVFFSTEPLVLMTLSIFLCAMVAGAVSSHACHTPAYIAFALPTALPFIARCVWEMTPFYVVLGLVAFVFVMVNVRYGRNLEKMVIQSIRLRFQNADLIEELTQQKRVAEQASVAKTRFLAAASHDLRQPVQAIELLSAFDSDHIPDGFYNTNDLFFAGNIAADITNLCIRYIATFAAEFNFFPHTCNGIGKQFSFFSRLLDEMQH